MSKLDPILPTSSALASLDAREPDERNRDAGLFDDFTDNGFADGSADPDPAPGQLPVAIVDPTDQ